MTRIIDTQDTSKVPEAGLTASRVHALFAERTAMLASLYSDINPILRSAIERKIAYEHRYLLESSASHAKALDAMQKLQTALKPEYFVQKTLDVSQL